MAVTIPAPAKAAGPPIITPFSATLYYNGTSVNVRATPSASATIVSKLKFADSVNVVGKTTYNCETWYKTSTGNFVAAKYLVSEKPIVTKIEADSKDNSKVTSSNEWKKSQAANTNASPLR